jgi:hypothetical protein
MNAATSEMNARVYEMNSPTYEMNENERLKKRLKKLTNNSINCKQISFK